MNSLCTSNSSYSIGEFRRLVPIAGKFTRELSERKALYRSLLSHYSLSTIVLAYGLIMAGPIDRPRFQPLVEQDCHGNKDEKSESTNNTANDRTSVV